MIQPEDNKTMDLFERMAQTEREAEALCGIPPSELVAVDLYKAEQRVLYQQMRALIAGTHTGAVLITNPRMTGRRITHVFIDECVDLEVGVVEGLKFFNHDDTPYEPAISVGSLKPKKAQWKNERSVFNRVNQGKKSK